MGETGVGKTKLLEMLETLYNKGINKMRKLQIYPINDQRIIDFIEETEKEVRENYNEKKLTLIFFDEINNCNSLGLIKEIMCNHSYLGKKINDNFVFLGACSPYRVLTKKMRENSLVYYNMKEKRNILNNLVYSVNPLPYSLFSFVFDFDSLEIENEKNYITDTIISLLYKNKNEGTLNDLDENDKSKLINDIIDSILICNDFIREKYDKSSISIGDIQRFGIFYDYFLEYFKKCRTTLQKMKSSLNLTLYLCYYLRLDKKQYKEKLSNRLKHFFNNNFLNIPEKEITFLTKEMSIEKGIALNRPLKEILFTSFFCVENNIPLIIVGKPGTGKSLGFQILYNTLKGEYSESNLFKDKGKLFRYYYQGSEYSTSDGIIGLFDKALKFEFKNRVKQIKTSVYFDKMDLAEISSNNPLTIIHYLLEKDSFNSIAFIGTTNWKLNQAIMNRSLNLIITDYDIEELEDTAISIAESLDVDLSNKYQYFFKILGKTYHEYIIFNQNYLKENRDFHGNLDFYSMIKIAMKELIGKKNELSKNEDKILNETAILCLNRNFGGLENSSNIIKKIFKRQYIYKFDEDIDINMPFSILDAIKKNILDPNIRYLMLISEGNDESYIIKYLLDLIGKKYIEIVGSKFNDLKTGEYT